MPQCDSSQTCMRAVRPEPSPADLQPDWTAGVSEVSRFSCMKFLGVPWGLRPRRTEQKLALSLLSMLPSAHVNRVGVRVVSFRGSQTSPLRSKPLNERNGLVTTVVPHAYNIGCHAKSVRHSVAGCDCVSF